MHFSMDILAIYYSLNGKWSVSVLEWPVDIAGGRCAVSLEMMN